MSENLLTETQAAELAQVSIKTLQMRRWKKQPPAFVKLGGRLVRYEKQALDAWIASCRVEPRNLDREGAA